MTYVYLIESVHDRSQHYVGSTDDLKARLADHNGGRSPHTAKFRPWHLVSYHAFADGKKAREFERYLKSGSGRAFANRRFW
jgi:putative endonuclease